MAKTTISFEDDSIDLHFLGISCQKKDIVFVSTLNSCLGEGFYFADNFEVPLRNEVVPFFIFKSFEFDARDQKALMLNNHSEIHTLLPKFKQLDYLLIANFNLGAWQQKLSTLDVVLLTSILSSVNVKPIIHKINPFFE